MERNQMNWKSFYQTADIENKFLCQTLTMGEFRFVGRNNNSLTMYLAVSKYFITTLPLRVLLGVIYICIAYKELGRTKFLAEIQVEYKRKWLIRFHENVALKLRLFSLTLL